MNSHFHVARSPEEAVRLAAELGPAAHFLAGGTELNNQASTLTVTDRILVTGLGLHGIGTHGADVADVAIGATVRLQQLVDAPAVPEALRRAASLVGNRNVRNAATIGGHIATNNPWGDLLPALVVLGARAEVLRTDGARVVPVEELLAAGVDGLITRVVVPRPAPDRRFGVEAHRRTANDISVVNAAVALTLEGGAVRDPRVAVGGVAPNVVRLPDLEAALAGRPLPDPETLARLAAERLSPVGDVRGSAAFKRHVASVLVARAARTCGE